MAPMQIAGEIRGRGRSSRWRTRAPKPSAIMPDLLDHTLEYHQNSASIRPSPVGPIRLIPPTGLPRPGDELRTKPLEWPPGAHPDGLTAPSRFAAQGPRPPLGAKSQDRQMRPLCPPNNPCSLHGRDGVNREELDIGSYFFKRTCSPFRTTFLFRRHAHPLSPVHAALGGKTLSNR